jgi:hypothetical protein
MQNALNWLRIGSSGGILWSRWWTFGFDKGGISWLGEWFDHAQWSYIATVYFEHEVTHAQQEDDACD